MISFFAYKKLADDEHSDLNELRGSKDVSQNKSWLYICIAFLSVGWTATVIFVHLSRPVTNGPLHAYTYTPIPKEVFLPVKKVFQADEHFVGDGIEANQYWDRLVAGTSAL